MTYVKSGMTNKKQVKLADIGKNCYICMRGENELADKTSSTMEYISVTEFAEKHDLSERTVRNWCAAGKIEGAFLTGKTWSIPADAPLPTRGGSKKKPSPLLKRLREEKEGKVSGGIYHRTQIDLTYNSNHIEGSKLTHDQTRYIFETNTIGFTDDQGQGKAQTINVDDIVETTNHFRCIDYIIDHAEDKLTEAMIKELHRILKTGPDQWFSGPALYDHVHGG